MRSKRLLIVGTILLFSVFVYGCGSGGESGSEPYNNPLVVNSTLETLKIEADFPPMQVDHQVYIAVSIYPTGGTGSVSEVPAIKNATPVVTNATPIGTPGMTLANAFGPDKSVVAIATLETSANIFSIAPAGPQTEPLDQPKVEWDWSVTPLMSGPQDIGVEIKVQWASNISGKQSSLYTLGYPKFMVNVQALPVVPTPTPTPPPPDPLAIVNAILLPLVTLLVGILSFIGLIWAAKIALGKRKTQQQNKGKGRIHPKE